jgi:hypothetical protein
MQTAKNKFTWDQCYDFRKKLRRAITDSKYNQENSRNITFSRKSEFFRTKMVNIAENGGHNTGHLMFSSRVEARSQCY